MNKTELIAAVAEKTDLSKKTLTQQYRQFSVL